MKPTSYAPRILRVAVGWLCLFVFGVGVVQAADLTITRGPTNFWHSVSIGATVTDRVWVSGGTSPYAFQWRFKGSPIAWATNYTITLTNVQVADAGPYDVVVTDSASASVTSDIDELEFNPMFEKITTGSVVTDSEPSGAALWLDWDNDGDLDLVVGNFNDFQSTIRPSMYRNDGGDVFTKVTNAVTSQAMQVLGMAAADFDNDGLVDLVLTPGRSTVANQFCRNLGNGEWELLSNKPFGRQITGANAPSWVDYDRDGFIDLFNQVGYWESEGVGPCNDELYRNLCDGTFQKMTFEQCGLGDDNAVDQLHAWCDYDNDGWPDVYLCGVRGVDPSSSGLYRNNGQGRFERVNVGIEIPAGATLVAIPAWPDIDSDGWPDLYLRTMLPDQSSRHLLFRNQGDGTFVDIIESSGLLLDPGYNRVGWGDYDNDGFLDALFVQCTSADPASCLYRNRGDGTFESVDIGSPLIDSASWRNPPSWGDYDNDGFLDVYQCNGRSSAERNYLYRNNRRYSDNSPNSNHWLKVRLEGRVSNRAAVGAKVRVQTTIGGKIVRQVRENSDWSYYPHTTQLAHFGLGDATNVTTLRIEWPSGIVREINNVAADQHLTIEEHEEYARENPLPVLTLVGTSTNGLELKIQEPAVGARYALEGSTDLDHWAMLLSRKSVGGTQDYTDKQATNGTARFYRVVVP